MRKALGIVVAISALSLGMGAAQAAPGYSTANVNIRTGPDTEFPSAGVIPEGTSVDVRGCLRDESWCDVRWGSERGWVFSEYLALEYRGQMAPIPDVGLAAFRLPVVVFRSGEYWQQNYVGRPWFKDRARWASFKPRPRPGWRAPPSGPRKPGWWRSGYRAPNGMAAPPEHWRRHDRR